MLRFVPASVRPLMPTRATLPTDACRLVQLRAGAALLDCSASANSALVSSKPTRSAELPLLPAKPLMPAPPTVSRRVVTVLPSASVSVLSLLSMAKPPLSCTKPNASSARLPLALRIWPSAPDRSSVRLPDGPVAMTRFCAA